MKLKLVTAAVCASAFGTLAAHAQTTIIQSGPPVVVERPATIVAPPTAVVVEPPVQSTTVQRNDMGILGNTTSTTTDTVGAGVDCRRQTVQTNTLLGSTTSSNQTCN